LLLLLSWWWLAVVHAVFVVVVGTIARYNGSYPDLDAATLPLFWHCHNPPTHIGGASRPYQTVMLLHLVVLPLIVCWEQWMAILILIMTNNTSNNNGDNMLSS